MRIMQQGDCLLVEIEKIPAEAKKKISTKDDIVLLRGEATGHSHKIEDSNRAELYEKDGTLYVATTGEAPVSVFHEEHKPVSLPGKSFFKLLQVLEFDPFENETRAVLD